MTNLELIEATAKYLDAALEEERKKLIDRACNWLRENAYFYVNDYTGSLDEKALADEFRRAMED